MKKLSELKRSRIRKVIEVNDEKVTIYNPTLKQRNEIFKRLNKSAKIEKQNGEYKAIVGLTDEDILYLMLKELTDLDIDLDIINNRKEVFEILNDPDELLLQVRFELEILLKDIVKGFISIFKASIENQDEDLEIDDISELLDKKIEIEKSEENLTELVEELQTLNEKLKEEDKNE